MSVRGCLLAFDEDAAVEAGSGAHERDLDGAEEALRQVLTLQPAHRVESVRLRLTKVAALLRTARLRDAPAARSLLEDIQAFAQPAAMLPGGGLAGGSAPG